MAKQTFDRSRAETRASTDSRMTLAHLEEQHRSLKKQVEYLGRKAFLTPAEQITAINLKKQKLATKDAISALRSRMN